MVPSKHGIVQPAGDLGTVAVIRRWICLNCAAETRADGPPDRCVGCGKETYFGPAPLNDPRTAAEIQQIAIDILSDAGKPRRDL